MKKYLFVVCFSTLLSGDFPGGYIGAGISLGTNKAIGFQISLAFAASSQPYVFPGISCGYRYSKNQSQKHYYYSDIQFTMNAFGVWGGIGHGISLLEGVKYKRTKGYLGYLVGGYIRDYTYNDKEKQVYNGGHLGLALPILGTNLRP